MKTPIMRLPNLFATAFAILRKTGKRLDDLTPKAYPYATKRPCIDTNYYETYNRENVSLVNFAGARRLKPLPRPVLKQVMARANLTPLSMPPALMP